MSTTQWEESMDMKSHNQSWNEARLMVEYGLTKQGSIQLLGEIQEMISLALQQERQASKWEMRKRCVLFGCVFGIPHVDKKPKKYCIFCGEPGYIDQDTWTNESPRESMQKTIDRLVEKYKTPEAIKKYLESLSQPKEE